MTQILFLLDLATDNPISAEEVEALLPDQRKARHVLRITEFGGVPGTRGESADFPGCADALVSMVAAARDRVAGSDVHFYVAGRAALALFAHLGFELSKWAQVTILNQRPDRTWDRIPITAPNVPVEPFFSQVSGLSTTVKADGYVAVFLSTGRVASEDSIRACLREQNYPYAGLVEMTTGGKQRFLDANNGPAASAEIQATIGSIPAAFPNHEGIALFIDGPASLALMAGRAINPNVFPRVLLSDFRERTYKIVLPLPWQHRVPAKISEAHEDQLARLRLFNQLRDEIQRLKTSLEDDDMPRWLQPEERQRIRQRLGALKVPLDPGPAFHLSVAESSVVFSADLLEAVRHAPDHMQTKIGLIVLLHELYHHDQRLLSSNHMGIGRAGFALEEVDYWADAFALGTLASRALRRTGQEGIEQAAEIVAGFIEAALEGIAAFDRAEQGERIKRLYERRLRRYLIWHLQRARALTLPSAKDAALKLFDKRLIVELAPLQGALDARHDKLVIGPVDGSQRTELFIVLDGRLLRSPSSAGFDPGRLIELVRTYNHSELLQACKTVREQHEQALTPWVK